jgi:circadian clock protein KaiC
MVPDRVPSGTVELDRILGGGFPLRSLVLVSGNPGTGKTTLSTRFLYHGASECGEKGAYVSFAENREDYFKNMQQLGMDLKKLENDGLFKFLDFPTMNKTAIGEATNEIVQTVAEFGAKRIVIDPLSAVLQILGPEDSRMFLHMVFGKLVKTAGATTLVIGEIPYGDSKTGFGIEEFVADGVIVLRHIRTGNSEKKILEIVKMRGVPVERSTFEYLIDKRYGGIGLLTLPIRAAIDYAPTERLSTGIKGLDKMLRGGVYRSSVTLIEGASGIGKTTVCLQFLVASSKNGETTLYLSFEEPLGQIRRMLKNYGLDHEKLSDRFVIESYVPEALTPMHYYTLVRQHIEAYHPTVLAIDTLTAIQRMLHEEDFVTFVRYLQLLCKQQGVTAIVTSTLGTVEAATRSGISTLADNIILMRYKEVKNNWVRQITILKTRGAAHERRVMPFEITDRGVVLHVRD